MSSDATLAPPDPDGTTFAALVSAAVSAGTARAAAEARRVRALAAAGHYAIRVMAGQRASVRSAEMALREIASEIAAAESLSDRAVQRQIDDAMTLVDGFPETVNAWEAGALTRGHVHAIRDVGTRVPVDKRAQFDTRAVASAAGVSPGRLKTRLAMLAEQLQPTTVSERHRVAHERRCVRLVTGTEGTSDLIATLPTVHAVAIYDRLTQQAQALIDLRRDDDTAREDVPEGEDAQPTAAPDVRTTDQLRADIYADLLLTGAPMADPTRAGDGPSTLGAIRAKIQVVVPALSIIRPGDENLAPAELIGHGPIDTHTAKALAEATTVPWDRVLTHPVTGAVLATDTYHRTTAIDRFLRARDRHCRWVGCTRPAIRCEIDHNIDWALGGTTEICNLCTLCQRHHTQKQFTRWEVRQLDGGVLEWTSPAGRTYRDYPEPYANAVRFLPDDGPPVHPPPPDSV